MSLQLTINSTVIQSADIASIPASAERLEFDDKLLPDSFKITLDNTAKTNYDDRYPASFFYGSDFYGWPLELYDNDLNNYVFKGKVKNITVNDNGNKIDIEATSFLQDLSEKNCVYSNASNKTIARIIYELLTDASNGNIDPDNIIYDGFQNTINIQDANSAYINITYTAEDATNIISIINELLRISQCHLYTANNLIYLYQWQAWNGIAGEKITDHDILPKTYKHYYKAIEKIKNKFNVAYDNAGTVAYSTGSDASSIAQFGEMLFNIPDQTIDSTTSSDFKILFRNVTGAAWAGNLALTRLKYFQKYCEFEMSFQKNYIALAEQLDLNWYPFYSEPMQIIERRVDSNKKTISIKGLFLNSPHQYFAKDYTPPDSVFIEAAFPLSEEGIFLKFTKNFSSDWAGYKIYFTASKGEWRQEFCNFGISPIDNKGTNVTLDGYVFAKIHQLKSGTQYYFYVTAYDTSGNESIKSNIISCRTYATGIEENKYRCQGNIFEDYIWLDEYNSGGGTVPAGFVKYGSVNYDSENYGPAAIYESGFLCNLDGWNFIKWKAAGLDNRIQYQYRTSDDNITYTAWTTALNAMGSNSINFNGEKYFQIRFLFFSEFWSDTDYVYIEDIG